MLQSIRDKAGSIIVWVIFPIIVIAFAFFGFSRGYTGGHKNKQLLAKIGEESIYEEDVNEIYQYHLSAHGAIEPANEKRIKQHILEEIVQGTALLQHLQKIGFVANYFLASRHMPNVRSEKGVRAIMTYQLENGLYHSNFCLPNEADEFFQLIEQKRDFGYTIMPLSAVKNKVSVTPQEIQEYYDKNQQSLISPLKVQVEYVHLNLDNLIKQTEVSDEELEKNYYDNQDQYVKPALVNLRVIFIQDDAKAADKVTAVMTRLKQGESFKQLVAEYSDDVSTVKRGGELGFLARAELDANDTKLGAAAFALKKPNDISNVVKTKRGLYILQLIEYKSEEIQEFNAIKAQLKEHYKREKAEQLFADQVESLGELAYSNHDVFLEGIKALNLPLYKSELLAIAEIEKARKLPTSLLSHKDVIQAVMSDEVLVEDKTSDLIRLSDDSILLLRLLNKITEHAMTLDEAKPQIIANLTEYKAKNSMRNLGQTIAEKLQAANFNISSNVLKSYNLPWFEVSATRDDKKIDSYIIEKAFSIAQKDKKITAAGYELPNGDYAVIALKGIVAGNKRAKTQDELNNLKKIAFYEERILYSNAVAKASEIHLEKRMGEK